MKQQSPSQFFTTLTDKVKESVAIVMHQSADPDAVGSAAALASLLTLRSKVKVQMFAESLNRSAKNIADAFNLPLAAPEDLALHSAIILVDLNNVEQMGVLAPHLPQRDVTTFCIDHHVAHKDLPKLVDFSLCDEEICSTAELVLQIWEASGNAPSADVATLLACGLVYDSRHFHIATNKTFEHFLSLLRFGADYRRVLNLLSTPLDKSERIARLKAAKRTVVYDEFGVLIAATTIRSYEASASRALIGLGADIAIACATKKDEVRVSSRCNSAVNRNYGLDLAKDVMEPLGELIGGAGGGHPSAAGANGTASSDHALGLALQLLRKTLKAHRDTSHTTPNSGAVG
ncbi:MAG: bifunctional oligoribonuclease/PAP phosphatase NrnA [Candidatus Hermodarchaeota archaeon]